MTRRLPIVATVAAALLVLTGCGDDDSASDTGGDETRTVEIDMADIAFEPDTLEVTAGERVRFVFTNTGEIAHDAFVGDKDAQADHEAEMRDADGDEHGGGHGDESEDAITLEPGDTGELTHTFDEAGTLEIGCHQPGHYDAGMRMTVEVA
jgi:uncharacterized cupredoxin-like copper-binding protein